jgi:hypothetical protein
MGEPLEVKDMSSMLRLVMPSPRALRPHAPPACSLSNLAPIEMLARSIHFQGSAPARPVVGKPCPKTEPAPSVSIGIHPLEPVASVLFTAPAWAIPGGYALCGLGLGLCNLIAPGYIQSCAHLLCPLWTLALALHTMCVSLQPGSGEVWAWGGVLTVLLLPFVIMVAAPAFVGFYLLVFSAFVSGMFWRRLQGAHFILVWVCWGGLLLACTLSVGVAQPYMHLCVATFFAISLGILNSGGVRCAVRVAWDGQPV